MNAKITKSFEVDDSIEKVWEYIKNPEQIVVCVPGASISEKIDESNFKGEVTTKFGPIKVSYNGQITINVIDDSTYTMELEGKGLDSKGKGSANMSLNASLSDKSGTTNVTFDMELSIVGMLAQFGARLIHDVSDQLLDKFVDNFKKLIAGKEIDSSINAGSVMGNVVKNKLGGIFGAGKEK